MASLNKKQVDEIVDLIHRHDIVSVFEKLKEYEVRNNTISQFSDEFIDGIKDKNFYQRLELYIRSLKYDESLEAENKKLYPYNSYKKFPLSASVLDLSELRPVESDRINIFVLGVAGAGKSLLIGGVLKYIDELNLLDITNPSSDKFLNYTNYLIESAGEGQVIAATPTNYFAHLFCNIKKKEQENLLLNFIEMSGEIFESTYLKRKRDLSSSIQKYIFNSSNKKVLFLTLDYSQDSNRQKKYVEYILSLLALENALQNVEAIIIVVTQWDKSYYLNEEEAINFFNDNYSSLINKCKRLEKEYDIKLAVRNFSIGSFINTCTYEYNSEYSKELFNLLCLFLPPQKMKLWWKRIIK